jgi:hypothetical protein
VTSLACGGYGWSPGAAIIVNTKSGTNSIRGTVYDSRNDSLDQLLREEGQSAEADEQPEPVGRQRRGPIVKNRAFFFGDYEGTRVEQGVLRTGRVLTADERRGIFTSAIRDPLTGQPFANNTIPANRIDPVAANIVALLPLPNASGGNNFINQPNVEDEVDRYLGRIDLPLGNDTIFGRYIYTDRFLAPRLVPGVSTGRRRVGVGPQLPNRMRHSAGRR